MAETFTEVEWINMLQSGSESAFQSLYKAYSASLYGIIYRIVPQESAAADVLQETFIKIWKSAASYNAAKGTLFTWMLNIARNAAIDHTRSKGFRQQNQNQADNVVMESYGQTEIPVDQIGIRDSLLKLKPDLQQVLEILYFQGYTHEEAADALGLPLGTVKTRARAAIQQLRTILDTQR